MPDMVSVSVSRAKSMLEGGRVARGHEVFGQQGRPRLWHDRLETQFFDGSCVDSVLPLAGRGGSDHRGRERRARVGGQVRGARIAAGERAGH